MARDQPSCEAGRADALAKRAGMASKAVLKMVKLRVPAGKATAGPPVGPTLGQV